MARARAASRPLSALPPRAHTPAARHPAQGDGAPADAAHGDGLEGVEDAAGLDRAHGGLPRSGVGSPYHAPGCGLPIRALGSPSFLWF